MPDNDHEPAHRDETHKHPHASHDHDQATTATSSSRRDSKVIG